MITRIFVCLGPAQYLSILEILEQGIETGKELHSDILVLHCVHSAEKVEISDAELFWIASSTHRWRAIIQTCSHQQTSSQIARLILDAVTRDSTGWYRGLNIYVTRISDEILALITSYLNVDLVVIFGDCHVIDSKRLHQHFEVQFSLRHDASLAVGPIHPSEIIGVRQRDHVTTAINKFAETIPQFWVDDVVKQLKVAAVNCDQYVFIALSNLYQSQTTSNVAEELEIYLTYLRRIHPYIVSFTVILKSHPRDDLNLAEQLRNLLAQEKIFNVLVLDRRWRHIPLEVINRKLHGAFILGPWSNAHNCKASWSLGWGLRDTELLSFRTRAVLKGLQIRTRQQRSGAYSIGASSLRLRLYGFSYKVLSALLGVFTARGGGVDYIGSPE